jgi:hypothetical protein
MRLLRIGALLLAGFSSLAANAAVTGASGFAIDGYQLVDSKRSTRTAFDYTYTADVSNWSAADSAVTATLTSAGTNVTIVQANLDFGSVVQGETRTSQGTFVIRIDRSQAFDPSALSWNVHATPLPPTTFALIDAAQASGALDPETALAYKVFSEFRDPRLPPQYSGRGAPGHEATAIQDAIEHFATLSGPTQTLLRPYLLPPEDPGSWYRTRALPVQQGHSLLAHLAEPANPGCQPLTDPNSGTVYDGVVPTANGKVCVHYFPVGAAFAGDDVAAASLAAEINDVIWPSLTHLFQEPPLDANGLLQVYLVDSANMVSLHPQSPGGAADLGLATICAGTVPHLFLNRDQRDKLDVTVAHELFHAISASYARGAACGEAYWLGEATATWAEHFVYPCANSEQPYAPPFLSAPSQSLEDRTDPYRPYGAYLWFLDLTKVVKSLSCKPGTGSAAPEYAPHVWSQLAINDSLGAIAAAVNDLGGMNKRWHDFALNEWNRDQSLNKPYVTFFQGDRLKDRAREAQGSDPLVVKLNGATTRTFPLAHTVRHLGATYYHFDFTKDDSIRRIRLIQPYSGTPADGNVKVQAIIKNDSGWQKAVDWTSFAQKTLCRDKPDQHFKELVIVISNSEFDDRGFTITDDGSRTKLRVSSLGCSNWAGSAQGTFDSTVPSDTLHSTTDAEGLKFERSFEFWEDDFDIQQFAVTAGNVSWKFTESAIIGFSLCTGDFHGSYGLASSGPFELMFSMGTIEQSGAPEYSIAGEILPPDQGGTSPLTDDQYALTCSPPFDTPIHPSITGTDGVTLWVLTDQGPPYPGINDTAGGALAGTLTGSFVLKDLTRGDRLMTWSLQKSGTFDDP